MFILGSVFTYLTSSAQAGNYCLPKFVYNADSNMITEIVFNDLYNQSSATSGKTPIYEDFTYLSANVNHNQKIEVFVKAPSSTFPSDVMLYIDFNQNDSFDDPGEAFYIGRAVAANPFNAVFIKKEIEIPATAKTGKTRMRFLKNTNVPAFSNPDAPNSISNACDQTLRAGQTEDYSIIIEKALSTTEIPSAKTSIYPNPTKDFVTIKSDKKIKEISIYNSSGQLVKSESITNKISLVALPIGNYFVEIIYIDGTRSKQSIIKK